MRVLILKKNFQYICEKQIRTKKDGLHQIVSWLPDYQMSSPELPSNIDMNRVLPIYVELNMDDFKITRTISNKPTSCNLIFKGIPFEEQEKMKNIFLIGMYQNVKLLNVTKLQC